MSCLGFLGLFLRDCVGLQDVLPAEQHAKLKALILELREQKIAAGLHGSSFPI